MCRVSSVLIGSYIGCLYEPRVEQCGHECVLDVVQYLQQGFSPIRSCQGLRVLPTVVVYRCFHEVAEAEDKWIGMVTVHTEVSVKLSTGFQRGEGLN